MIYGRVTEGKKVGETTRLPITVRKRLRGSFARCGDGLKSWVRFPDPSNLSKFKEKKEDVFR